MRESSFQVIPVLDLKDGRAVRAVAGQRAYYQPIRSVLHTSSDPFELARAFRDVLGLQSLYLADLNAIEGEAADLAIYRNLVSMRIHLMVDAGLRVAASAAPLLDLDSGYCSIVAGLETLRGPHELALIVEQATSQRVVFSLDLFDGISRVAVPNAWRSTDAWELAHQAIELGVTRILLLDIARVGTSRGVGTSNLMARIREAYPKVQLLVGGGISQIEEIVALKNSGGADVLVGSALHDGRIGRAELARLASGHPAGYVR